MGQAQDVKGDDYDCIEVLCLMVGVDFPLEQSANGYRVSPRYLLLGRDYAVVVIRASLGGPANDPVLRLLDSLSLNPAFWLYHLDRQHYYVGGVWPATPENVSGIEARLAGK